MQHGNKTRGTAVLGGGGMVSLWGASSLIRSVQFGVATIPGAATSGTATIASVDVANAAILYGGHYSASDSDGTTNPGCLMTRIALTNATTISAFRTTADPLYGRYAPFCVIEFTAGVLKSVQTGTVSQSANSATATITAVNTAKSFVASLGNTTSYTSSSNNIYSAGVTLTNATTVTVSVAGGGASNWVTGYIVVEFF